MTTSLTNCPITQSNSVADLAERVGPLAMQVALAEPTAEAAERWNRRSEVLAEWLLDVWRREQERA